MSRIRSWDLSKCRRPGFARHDESIRVQAQVRCGRFRGGSARHAVGARSRVGGIAVPLLLVACLVPLPGQSSTTTQTLPGQVANSTSADTIHAQPLQPDTAGATSTRNRNLIVAGSVLLLAIVGVVLGITDKAVFYARTAEALIVAGLVIGSIVVVFVATAIEDGDPIWGRRLALLLFAVAGAYAYVTAFVSNHNPLKALSVGTAKIVIVLLFLFALLQALSPPGKTSRERTRARSAGIAAGGLLGFLMWHLVNADRVAGRE